MDAGNFGGVPDDFAYWTKTEFIWDVMARLKYDVVTPGDAELLEGVDALKALVAKHPEIQVVSANLQDRSGKLLFPKFTVVEREGVRIGVVGITGKTYYDFNIKKGKQKKDDFVLLDSKEALQSALVELRPKVNIVVALLHEGVGDVKRILDQVQGIDVVVVGHNPSYMFNPDRVGNTLLLLGGMKGQYLSVLTLTLDGGKKKILDYSGEGKPLGDDVAKESALEAVVKEWEDGYNKRKRSTDREKAARDASLQGTEKYVGAEVCARCHAEEYSRWSQTAHAHAYESLAKEGNQLNEACLKCHVVGLGELSGYSITALGEKEDDSSTKDTRHLRNVQCESCHGIGTYHGTTMLVKAPDEESCRNCHSGEFEKGFNYAEALAKGAIH